MLPVAYPVSPRIWWNALSHLLYPQLCVACNAALTTSAHQCFCFKCRAELEPADFPYDQNEIIDRLWGRVPVARAAALYYFRKKSPVQWALHHLKYSNQPDIGRRLGRLLGYKMQQSGLFKDIDLIVPVPLHPLKERERGYNQSHALALGLAESLQVPVGKSVLARAAYTASQTRKHRMERFQNVGEVFTLQQPHRIPGKNILLADDVLTTGATIEYCGNLLHQGGAAAVSIATIALASHQKW